MLLARGKKSQLSTQQKGSQKKNMALSGAKCLTPEGREKYRKIDPGMSLKRERPSELNSKAKPQNHGTS